MKIEIELDDDAVRAFHLSNSDGEQPVPIERWVEQMIAPMVELLLDEENMPDVADNLIVGEFSR